MAARLRHLGWAAAAAWACLAPGGGHAGAQIAPDPAPEAREDARLAEADRLTGASLSHLARQRELRQAMRDRVQGLDREIRAMNNAVAALESTMPDPESRAAVLSRLSALDAEQARLERWLWGEEEPDEAGLTRAELEDRLRLLHVERTHAELLARAHALEDAAERSRLRVELLVAIRALAQEVVKAAQPIVDDLEALDVVAAEYAEPFEAALSAFAQVGVVGAVVVDAADAGAWFKDRMVSYRWMDADGRLVATAQARLRPTLERDPEPPLLLDRFAIDAHTDQEARVSVGHFTIVFRVTVHELEGEARVLDALARLLDLDALSRVRPMLGGADQN